MEILQPPGWPRPKGYSNGIVARGRTIFLGGQVGWNESETFETSDFAGQFKQILNNIVTILKEADAGTKTGAKGTGRRSLNLSSSLKVGSKGDGNL